MLGRHAAAGPGLGVLPRTAQLCPASPQLLSAMVARLGNRDDPLPQDSFEGVDEDEWVRAGDGGDQGPALFHRAPHLTGPPAGLGRTLAPRGPHRGPRARPGPPGGGGGGGGGAGPAEGEARQGRGPHRDRPSSGAEPRAHRGQAPLLKPLHQHPCPAVIPGRGRAPGTGVGTHGTGPEEAAAWGSPHA